MATNYPTTADNGTNLPNPSSGNFLNSPDHASLHGNANDAIKALEAKLGIGASTPVASRLMYATGTGTSAWTQLTSAQLAASLSNETGTGLVVFNDTPTLLTPKVDTINENTVANGVTIDGVLLKDNKVNGSYITDSTVANAQLATGVPVQMVNTTASAVATGTTLIPHDDTIPQITEGDQYMTLAVTPKSATNILVISVTVQTASVIANGHATALFQDATANALAAISTYQPSGNTLTASHLEHAMVAGTTSATTFRVRCGQSSASTLTFNGNGGVRIFGAITKSSIVITEYKV
jgi:hypothetical protein